MKKLIKSTPAYKILSGDRRGGRLSHAYMLYFPDPKNLRDALKIFAAELLGAEEDEKLYSRIMHESYTDFKIYPAEGGKILLDGISEILEDSLLRPAEGNKKLYVISGFENASALIQNKLLKTLEEPLEGVHFILGTCSLAPVLDTVKSRVKLLEIAPFSEDEIYAALERKSHREINRTAAESSDGIFGNAENIADGSWFGEVREGARAICSALNVADMGALAVKYGDTKYKNELLSEMQRLYFDKLNGRVNGLDKLTRPALIYALEKLNGAFADVRFNASFQGLLYDFMLEVAEENKKWLKLQG